jgi:uncharacterized protein (TIGR03067 family)
MRGMREEPMHADAGAATLRALDGWWIAHRAILGGVALPADIVPELSLLIFNGGFYFGKDEGTVAIDLAASPAAMDVRIVRGPNRLRFVPAVFRLTGHTLCICYDLSGIERPAEFSAPLGTRRRLVTYERMPDSVRMPGRRQHAHAASA